MLAALLSSASLLACASRANATLVITPSTIANDYVGPIDLTITGLDSAGQTVVIEEYIDADNSGTINAGDILIRKIQVTDGQVTSIAGQRNVNVPGDEDGATNSQIDARMLVSQEAIVDRIDGSYVFRVSPAGAGFTPFTASLTVTQKDYSGSGISGSTGQAGAFVLIQTGFQGSGDTGTFSLTRADAAGNYSAKVPPGTYHPVATKSGFVFDGATGPAVTVTSGAFATNQNLMLVASTRTISGTLRDATTLLGLPGVAVEGSSQAGFVSLTFADASGNYTVDANSDTWKIGFYEQIIAQLGYVHLKSYNDSSPGNVTGFNIDLFKVTSLIYGTVKTPANVAVPFIDISGMMNGSPGYRTSSVTDANGNYSLGVTIGAWQTTSKPTGYLIQDQNVVVNTDGSAVLQNLIANPVTAHLRGQIRDNHNNTVGNIVIIAFDPVQSDNNVNAFATADANGNFDLGVYGGGGTATKQWELQLNQGNGPQNFVSSSPIFNVRDGVDINGINYLVYVVTAHLRGQVLDENNAPIGNIFIYASLNPNGVASAGSNVDGGGNFDLALFGGNWSLGLSNIDGLGLIPQDFSIDVTDNVDQNTIVFRALHANETISGSVKSSNNVAIGGVNVFGSATLNGASYSSSTTTDPSGNYTLPVFSTTWSVGVDSNGLASQGYQAVSSQNVFVSSNVTGINFVAAALVKISSIAHLANGHIFLQGLGAPNAGFHIQASPDLSPGSFVNVAPVTADGSGAFTYEDTNPGTRRFYRVASP